MSNTIVKKEENVNFLEELLKPDDNRFVMFPIKHNDV